MTKYTQRHVIPSTPGGEPENEFVIDGLAVLEYENAAAVETAWASEAGIAALADVPNSLGKHFVIVPEDHDVI